LTNKHKCDKVLVRFNQKTKKGFITMSETITEKPDIHQREERRVKAAIRNGGDAYEYSGRESDPRVAEAMAYAAKPLIEGALNDLDNPANEGLATFSTSDGKVLGLNKLPGVVNERGYEVPYVSIKSDVLDAHKKASDVQTGYYDNVDAARKAVRAAEEALEKATTDI
jgi:hypothetical protein